MRREYRRVVNRRHRRSSPARRDRMSRKYRRVIDWWRRRHAACHGHDVGVKRFHSFVSSPSGYNRHPDRSESNSGRCRKVYKWSNISKLNPAKRRRSPGPALLRREAPPCAPLTAPRSARRRRARHGPRSGAPCAGRNPPAAPLRNPCGTAQGPAPAVPAGIQPAAVRIQSNSLCWIIQVFSVPIARGSGRAREPARGCSSRPALAPELLRAGLPAS
jgi:hypothetical protein